MNTSFNTRHFTHHTGSTLQLNSCCSIVYFTASEFPDLGVLTVTSLPDQYAEILRGVDVGSGVGRSLRESPEEDFLLVPSHPGGLIKFDTVLYLNSSEVPVGFTTFSESQTNLQGGSKILEMRLNFLFSIVSKTVDFKVTYSLDPIWATTEPLLTKKFPVRPGEVKEGRDLEKDGFRYVRYTDDLQQLGSRDNYCITTDASTLLRDTSVSSWIPSGLELSGFQDFTDYNIGILGDDLVLYRWNKSGDFSTDSLTRFNRYGVLSNISSGTLDIQPGDIIETLVDNLAIIGTKNARRSGYIELTTGHRYQDDQIRVINNSWDSSGRVTIVRQTDTSETLGLRSLSSPPGDYYYLIDHPGPWYKFWNPGTSTICWAGVYGSAWFKDTDPVFPFSNRALIWLDPRKIKVYLFDGMTEFNLGDPATHEMTTKYSENRELVDSIRRKPLRNESLFEVGQSPCVVRGLIFYVSSDKIYCL